jgi:hypothetical protein
VSATRTIEVPPIKDGRQVTPKQTVKVDRDGIANLYTKTPDTRPLTVQEARAFAEDKWPAASPGADALYASGTVTVLTDREHWEKTRREAVEAATESAKRNNATATASEAKKIAEQFKAHTAHLQQMAAEAKGNRSAERNVAEQIQQSAAVGDELKRRGILK